MAVGASASDNAGDRRRDSATAGEAASADDAGYGCPDSVILDTVLTGKLNREECQDMKERRKFGAQYKAKLVLEIVSGQRTVAEIARKESSKDSLLS
jgi:hypothetical protein